MFNFISSSQTCILTILNWSTEKSLYSLMEMKRVHVDMGTKRGVNLVNLWGKREVDGCNTKRRGGSIMPQPPSPTPINKTLKP